LQKIVLFGDSITAGYLEEAVSPVLVDLVSQKLQTAGLKDVVLVNAGLPGDTTVDGLKRLEQEVMAEDPDLVVVFFGANDASVDRKVPLAMYQQNLETIVKTIGSEKVVLITSPYTDSARKPERPQDRIRENVAVGLTIGEKYQLPVINLFEAMLAVPDVNQLLQRGRVTFYASRV
jgi:lysophospholipase L1-like esterase